MPNVLSSLSTSTESAPTQCTLDDDQPILPMHKFRPNREERRGGGDVSYRNLILWDDNLIDRGDLFEKRNSIPSTAPFLKSEAQPSKNNGSGLIRQGYINLRLN